MKFLLFHAFIVSLTLSAWISPAFSAQVLRAVKVDQPPVIDGSGQDTVWNKAETLTVQDKVGKVGVQLKAVRTADSVFFLVRYPSASERRLHKPWVWDKEYEIYTMGPQREDTFTFKWNMMEHEVDLDILSDDNYTADVWYWKANRWDPVGHADDQSYHLGDEPGRRAMELTSRSGKKRYYTRIPDAGGDANTTVTPLAYQKDVVDQFVPTQPSGSRADVRAKGVWKDGFWTIEFGRKLSTGHSDDLRFDPASGKKYLFGVSIYGIYGEKLLPGETELYGKGRISDPLYLSFD